MINIPKVLINFNFEYIYNFFISKFNCLIPIGIQIYSEKLRTNWLITNPSKLKIIKKNYKLVLIGNIFKKMYKSNTILTHKKNSWLRNDDIWELIKSKLKCIEEKKNLIKDREVFFKFNNL